MLACGKFLPPKIQISFHSNGNGFEPIFIGCLEVLKSWGKTFFVTAKRNLNFGGKNLSQAGFSANNSLITSQEC